MVNDREKERERLIRKHYTKDRHHGKNLKKPQSLNKRFLLLLFRESCDSFFATTFLQLFAKYPAPKHHQYARMYEDNNQTASWTTQAHTTTGQCQLIWKTAGYITRIVIFLKQQICL